MYWDSSALVKLYAPEADSGAYEQIADASVRRIRTSAIALVEMYSALTGKERRGELRPGQAEHLFETFLSDVTAGELLIVDCNHAAAAEARRAVRACSRFSPPVAIRSLDAIHLGSAIAVRATAIVTVDKRLRQAAKVVGFRVVP